MREHSLNQHKFMRHTILPHIMRTIAMFGALMQCNLFAGELSDISIYTATLLCAICSGYALSAKKIKKHCAVISLILAPFAARVIIMLPCVFSFNNIELNIILDSLLLTFDRNNFVSLIPFYYASITTFAAGSSRGAVRTLTLCDCAVIIFIFCAAQIFAAQNTAIMFYKLPVVLITIFGILFLLELAARIFAIPSNYKLQKNEAFFSIALVLLLTFLGGAMLLYKVQKGDFEKNSGGKNSSEAAAGYGLMRPGLFSFDMTPFLNLHTEVSMQNELVFIVRTEGEAAALNKDKHIFMRRFILSDGEFKRSETIDEKSQRSLVPSGAVSIDIPEYKKRSPLKQEYYIKNIGGDALLAMNEPISITPFDNYDYSSFKSVYAVESLVSEALPIDLYNAANNYLDDDYFGLSKEEFEWYTALASKNDRVKNFAFELTDSAPNVYAKAILLLNYFVKGDFRYSLKPGIAPDGDQLSHFLWTTKRGYCSYFALAYATMLRSLQIPCRIAVGFFLDPETEKFGFYPVRSGNAHAWVEIYFPNYGWIAFDPTTDKFAEDELQPEAGAPSLDSFENLMKEIIENRDKLKAKQKSEEEQSPLKKIIQEAAQKAKPFVLPLVILFIIVCALIIRFKYLILSFIISSPRKKTIFLWRHIRLLLRLNGRGSLMSKKPANLSESEWIHLLAEKLPSAEPPSEGTRSNWLLDLYDDVEKARYAPRYSSEDAKIFVSKYKSIKSKFKQRIKFVLIALVFTFAFSQNSARCQQFNNDTNTLFDSALDAVYGEYWEQAISLFNKGKKDFPEDFRFPFGLANLYFSKQLYNLARDEYAAVLDIIPDYPEALYRIAISEGSLNNYESAARYYEKYCELYPGSYSVISELAWIYFKLHRLREGEELLLNAISEFSGGAQLDGKITASPQLAMTLATIYSDMMNYEESVRWYTEAINSIYNSGEETIYHPQSFSATAWYNFAILESRFYNYEKSFEYAKKSLASYDRDTGHMMQGELYLRRLEWTRSFAEYEKAFTMDNRSPLPKISLAQNFLISGRLEEALAYAKDCLKAKNGAWMFRFGIDSAQYERDVHEILYKTYKGLYHKQKFIVYNSLSDWLRGKSDAVKYQFNYRVNKYLFEKNALKTARSYKREELGGQYIEALIQFYTAFERYPRRAAFYLKLAEAYETALINEAKPAYLYELGKIEKNTAMLEDALAGFDAVWERDMSANALTEIARFGTAQKKYEAAPRLFMLNAGALLQNEIKLPVRLNIKGGAEKDRQKLKRRLAKAGFEPRGSNSADFTLHITINGKSIDYALVYDITNTAFAAGSVPSGGLTGSGLTNAANLISAAIMTANSTTLISND